MICNINWQTISTFFFFESIYKNTWMHGRKRRSIMKTAVMLQWIFFPIGTKSSDPLWKYQCWSMHKLVKFCCTRKDLSTNMLSHELNTIIRSGVSHVLNTIGFTYSSLSGQFNLRQAFTRNSLSWICKREPVPFFINKTCNSSSWWSSKLAISTTIFFIHMDHCHEI